LPSTLKSNLQTLEVIVFIELILSELTLSVKEQQDFPGGPVVQNLPAKAGDMGLIHGLGKSHMPWAN